jgi:hypothetical protein
MNRMLNAEHVLPRCEWEMVQYMDPYESSLIEQSNMLKARYAVIKKARKDESATASYNPSVTLEDTVDQDANMDNLQDEEQDITRRNGMSRSALYKYGEGKLHGDRPDVLVRWIGYINKNLQDIKADKTTIEGTWDIFMELYGNKLLGLRKRSTHDIRAAAHTRRSWNPDNKRRKLDD